MKAFYCKTSNREINLIAHPCKSFSSRSPLTLVECEFACFFLLSDARESAKKARVQVSNFLIYV